MRHCFYCKSQPSVCIVRGRAICSSQECKDLDKQHRHKKWLESSGKLDYDSRICESCGRSLKGTRRERFCARSKCQEVRKQELYDGHKKYITDRFSPKEEQKPRYKCQRCFNWIIGPNRIHCTHCASLLANVYDESAIGFGIDYIQEEITYA